MVTTNPSDNIQVLTRKDFVSDQEVRWCPGCGDYSILAQTQRVMPDLGIPRENIVFISGIGCSSRLPYYMNTYGFHSIHGRAPTIATGLKVIAARAQRLGRHRRRRCPQHRRQPHPARHPPQRRPPDHPAQQRDLRPDQGPVLADLAAVEGHLLVAHGLHRLAAASPSPSPSAPKAPSSPARSTPTPTTWSRCWSAPPATEGTSFVEIYQNCNIYNDGAFEEFTAKDVRADRMLYLKHGEPMIFGKNADKGIRINGLKPEVVELGKDGITEKDVLVHDETIEDPTIAFMLARMDYPEFPVPVGVIRAVQRPTYDSMLEAQVAKAREDQGEGDIAELFRQGDTWLVGDD